MINNLTDKDILIKLESHPDVLKFLVRLSPIELELFDQIQRLPVQLLSILSSHPDVLKFLIKLSPTDLELFNRIQQLPVPLLSILGSHLDVLTFLIKLSPTELDSFAELQHWPVPLLTIIRNHPDLIRILFNIWDVLDDKQAFCKAYSKMVALPDASNVNITDAFSHGQLKSKTWLVDTVCSLGLELGQAWTLCGWIGTLGYLMLLKKSELGLTKVRSFDIDDSCAPLADMLNKIEILNNWCFKATTMDVNEMSYDAFSYNTKKYDLTPEHLIDTADTVINTSCDHMGGNNTWWERIPSDKLIILQNNNWHENDQHNNSVDTVDEFKSMYPMSELLFAGELDCTLYTRFMLIGRK